MNKEQVFVKMALLNWDTQTNRAGELFDTLSDEQVYKETAPGKNTGIYLFGHLIAIHDAMNTILGFGKRSHEDMDEAFVKNPDKSGFEMPSVSALRKYWKEVHEQLNNSIKKLTAEEWFTKHNSMTDEDFAKDPARNKMSVLLSRTNHLAYHLGQLRLLK